MAKTFWDRGRGKERRSLGRGHVFIPLKLQHVIRIRLTLSVRIIRAEGNRDILRFNVFILELMKPRLKQFCPEA